MKRLLVFLALMLMPVLSMAAPPPVYIGVKIKCHLFYLPVKGQIFFVSVLSNSNRPMKDFTLKSDKRGMVYVPTKYQGNKIRFIIPGAPSCKSATTILKPNLVMTLKGVDCGQVSTCLGSSK